MNAPEPVPTVNDTLAWLQSHRLHSPTPLAVRCAGLILGARLYLDEGDRARAAWALDRAGEIRRRYAREGRRA